MLSKLKNFLYIVTHFGKPTPCDDVLKGMLREFYKFQCEHIGDYTSSTIYAAETYSTFAIFKDGNIVLHISLSIYGDKLTVEVSKAVMDENISGLISKLNEIKSKGKFS